MRKMRIKNENHSIPIMYERGVVIPDGSVPDSGPCTTL